MRRAGKTKKKIWLLLAAAIFLLLSAGCFGIRIWLSGLLPSQKEAERWQGEGELAFSQISCFLPANKPIGLSDVSSFRSAMLTKLKEASFDVEGDQQLMLDAWSTTTKLYTDGQHGRGEASVIAVGGSYFDFHPLRLLSGDYLRQSDLMEDRILLGEKVAWMLFGGRDLQGMTMKLNGTPFIVAGVVEQEKDFASRKANSDSLDLYMSYDGLLKLNPDAKISCYEVVLAEPVKGFALNAVKDKFPIGSGEIVCNTTRYEFGKLMDLVLHFGSRGTQTTGTVPPYWENAARITENWAGLCVFLGCAFLIFPTVTMTVWIVRLLRLGKEELAADYWPAFRDRAEEAIRVRQRRRWERRHGEHEKET